MKIERLDTVQEVGCGRVVLEGSGSFRAKRDAERTYGRFLYLRNAVRVTMEPAGVDPALLALTNAPVIEDGPSLNHGVLAEIDAHVTRFLGESRGEPSDLLAEMQRAKACIEAVFTARNPTLRRDLLMKCAALAVAAIRELDRAQALASGEPPLAGEESVDG